MKPRPLDIRAGTAYRVVQPSGREEVRLVHGIGKGSTPAEQMLIYSVLQSPVESRVGRPYELTRKAFARYAVSEIAVARPKRQKKRRKPAIDMKAIESMMGCCDRLHAEIRGAIDILQGVLDRGEASPSTFFG